MPVRQALIVDAQQPIKRGRQVTFLFSRLNHNSPDRVSPCNGLLQRKGIVGLFQIKVVIVKRLSMAKEGGGGEEEQK